MLTCPALTAAAFAQLSAALNAEIQELREAAQHRYHDEAMPMSSRPLLQRAEHRAQLLERAEQLKAEWHTSTLVVPWVNLFEQNQSRLRPRKGAMLIRHFKGVTEKVAAECLGVDVKQIRAWLESGELKGFRATGGPWKIPREEISAFAKRHERSP
jgi:excisionase family DNA binding protein